MLFLIILVLLILANSYFSAAEIAIVSVKKFKIQEEADKGNRSAKQILEFLKDPEEYLSSIQVGITLVGMIEGLYGGEVLEAWLEPRFLAWGLSSWLAHVLGIVLGIGFITYVTIVIGELLPKTIALQQPQKVALRVTPSFRIFTLLAFPFVKLLTMSTRFMVKILGIRNPENPRLTEADLKNLLSLAYRQGTLEKNEYILHQNIFTFYERTVGTIMTPHEKLIVIEETMTPEAVDGLIRGSRHNYFPVVRQKREVVGFISAKEFLMTPGKPIREVVRSACTLTGDKTASDLLQKFQERKQNFGIVVNEKGELAGVVTMHDIVEEIVGQIP